jgi:hypothetical protein
MTARSSPQPETKIPKAKRWIYWPSSLHVFCIPNPSKVVIAISHCCREVLLQSNKHTHTTTAHSSLSLCADRALRKISNNQKVWLPRKHFPADTFQRVLNWRSLMKIKIRNSNVHRMSRFWSNWGLSLNVLLYVPSGSNLIVLLKKEHIGFKQTIIIFPSSKLFGCQ